MVKLNHYFINNNTNTYTQVDKIIESFDSAAPENVNRLAPVKTEYKQYFDALENGVPKEDVKKNMQNRGIDPKILDMDPDDPYLNTFDKYYMIYSNYREILDVIYMDKFQKSCQNSKIRFMNRDSTLEEIYKIINNSYSLIREIMNTNPCLKDNWKELSKDHYYNDTCTQSASKRACRSEKSENSIEYQEASKNIYDIINTSEFIEQANKCKQEGYDNCYQKLLEDGCKSRGYKSCKQEREEREKKKEGVCKKKGFLSCKNKKEELKNKKKELCKKEGFLSCDEKFYYDYHIQRNWQDYEAYVKKYDNKKIFLEKRGPVLTDSEEKKVLFHNLGIHPNFYGFTPSELSLDDKVWEWSNKFTLNLNFLKNRSSFFISFYDPNKSDIYNDKFYEKTKEKIWLSRDLKNFVSSTDPKVLKYRLDKDYIRDNFDFFLEKGLKSEYECWGDLLSDSIAEREACSKKRSDTYMYLKLVPEDKIPKKDFIESLKGGGISNNIIIFLILFFIIYFWKK